MNFPRILKKRKKGYIDRIKPFMQKISSQGVNRATPCRQKVSSFTNLLKKF